MMAQVLKAHYLNLNTTIIMDNYLDIPTSKSVNFKQKSRKILLTKMEHGVVALLSIVLILCSVSHLY